MPTQSVPTVQNTHWEKVKKKKEKERILNTGMKKNQRKNYNCTFFATGSEHPWRKVKEKLKDDSNKEKKKNYALLGILGFSALYSVSSACFFSATRPKHPWMQKKENYDTGTDKKKIIYF